MKTTITFIILISAFSMTLYSQSDLNLSNEWGLKSDTLIADFQNLNKVTGKTAIEDFVVVEEKDLLQDHRIDGNHFYMDKRMPGHLYDALRDQKFPGASRFYAMTPELMPALGDSKFNLRPNMHSKYYLIIMDPITNRISK